MTQTPADLVARDFGDLLPLPSRRRRSANGWGRSTRASGRTTCASRIARRRAPQLGAVRDQVVREWENERRQRARTTPTRRCAADIRSASRRSWRRNGDEKRSLPLVAVALLLTAVVPARADEFKPGYLQLTQLDQRDVRRPLEDPRDRRVHHAQVKPQFPDGTEALTRCAAPLARRDGAALAHPCAGRARRQGHLLLAALGNPDRRARAARAPGRHRAARAHPAGEPQLRRQASPGRLEVVTTYTILGIEHILSGFDHPLLACSLVGPGDCSSPSPRSRPRTA